jgi:hypothetical protein
MRIYAGPHPQTDSERFFLENIPPTRGYAVSFEVSCNSLICNGLHRVFRRVGWYFAHRRAEILFGVLNLSGRDYHLNPVTVYSELPRSRVYQAQLKFVF